MKYRIELQLLSFVAAIGMLFILAGCSKMNSTYYTYIKDGPHVYTGRADEPLAAGGKNRIKLSWLLVSDPSITQCRVFWMQNGVLDSVSIPVQRTAGVDTIQTIIDGLEENNYTFTIYTYDAQGHSSVANSTIGEVYGNLYISNLTNRQIVGGDFIDGSIVLDWGVAPDTVNISTTVKYLNSLSEEIELELPAENSALAIPDYQWGSTIYYNSSYIPNRNAIDTFRVSYNDSLIINP